MRFSTLKYYVDSATESLIKNRIMSIASVITVMSCIFIFILSFTVASNLDYFLIRLESTISFMIYFEDDIDETKVLEFKKDIEDLINVEEVIYIDKKHALDDAKDKFKDSEIIIYGLEEDNPLPRSLEISLKDITLQDDTVKEVDKIRLELIYNFKKENLDLEEDFNYDNLIRIKSYNTQFITNANRTLRLVSGVIVIAMGFLSIVIITNTIKLTVNNRKKEINIMKYVGATDWFIRWPFIIEGIFIGLIGGGIALLIAYFSYKKLISTTDANNFILKFLNIENFMSIKEIFSFMVPASFLMGALIGIIGSGTSIRKHLNV